MPTAAELFGECSFTDSVSHTQDTVHEDVRSVERDEAVQPNPTDKEPPSIKNDTDATNTQQVCVGIGGPAYDEFGYYEHNAITFFFFLHQNH